MDAEVIEQIRRQHYLIGNFDAFAEATGVYEQQTDLPGRQASRDFFSIALDVRQAMKTARAHAVIFTAGKTASSYYGKNTTLDRLTDELIPPPSRNAIIGIIYPRIIAVFPSTFALLIIHFKTESKCKFCVIKYFYA